MTATQLHQSAHVTSSRSASSDPTDHAARQRREAARARDLTALLQQRPDLAGVHPPADFYAEAVRWCA